MGHPDRAFAAGWYSAQAANAKALTFFDAAMQPYLQAVDPVAERWERIVSRPAEFEVKHAGIWWFVRMECDSFDGDVGPRATDWWLSAVKIDGVWFDAQDTLAQHFIDALEDSARKTPE